LVVLDNGVNNLVVTVVAFEVTLANLPELAA
jgi:hypothetical protein